MNKTIYLRAESKGMEARSALTPSTVRELGENGFELIVERSQQRAISDDNVCWHHSYSIDKIANSDGSAMARLVSLTLSLTVHAIATGEIGPDVSATPSDPLIAKEWLTALKILGEHVEYIEH
jgi:hypothetical protein